MICASKTSGMFRRRKPDEPPPAASRHAPCVSVQVQSEDSVLLFVAAWTVTEIIRYSFYTFSLLNHLPYLIKWAR